MLFRGEPIVLPVVIVVPEAWLRIREPLFRLPARSSRRHDEFDA